MSTDDHSIPTERQLSAADVALTYANDREPGIRRRKSGARFHYFGLDGQRVRDPVTLDRIGALVIPPAWTDVWIAPDPDLHIQVTGRDQRGRKQYRYHERWTLCRDEVKYASLVEFAKSLPRLRRTIAGHIAERGLGRDKVLATVTSLLDMTMIRVGNSSYARDNGSFGLTTFQDQHVSVQGSTLRFRFRGKSGKDWQLKVTDRRIARIVKGAQDLPGQHLFQYLDEDGNPQRINSNDVNAFIRSAGVGPFTSKHFRTWGGTVRALNLFSELEPPESKRGLAAATNAVVDAVSRDLGNTRAVCRRCYIHPLVIAHWQDGGLNREVSKLRRRYRRPPSGLSRWEYLALKWLEAAT